MALLIGVLWSVHAQDQEKKLLDRLLKPDMTLQNNAQNKKFAGERSASFPQHANVGNFCVQQKASSKNFSGTRDLPTTQIYGKAYSDGRSGYQISLRQALPNSKAPFAGQTVPAVHAASQAGKAVDSRPYAGNRPFLDEGKSQKSLKRHNDPLTIEQVRELLNKNK